MKICWDTLENLEYIKKLEKWRKNLSLRNKKYKYYSYIDECKNCHKPFLALADNKSNAKFCDKKCANAQDFNPMFGKTGLNNPQFGRKHSLEDILKMSKPRIKKNKDYNPNLARKLENNSNWHGGLTNKYVVGFNVYASQLEKYEKVRPDPENNNILQVECTYCGKFFTPNPHEVRNRIKSINGYKNIRGENRFYCSDECKRICPIYRQRTKYRFQNKSISREVQPELRQMVFARDNWTCTKCNSTKSLECHHKDGIRWNPIESADIDVCTTVCSNCHSLIHQKDDCKYTDMQCK